MSHSDIHSRLRDALNDHLKGTGNYGYVNDVFGDDESGDVVYSHNGDIKKSSYSMGSENGKPMCSIDFASAKDVVPVTRYMEEAGENDDADHVASMESEKLYADGTNIRAVERYISKSDREAMPKEDFAGKGTSFPIKTAEDVEDAARSIGRAGSGNLSMSAIKKRIIAIAKRKGFESSLPKAWREANEAARVPGIGALKLKESVAFEIDIPLREAFAGSRKIKLIAPGAGSSAFYPAEVLKRDGPKVFKAGTPMRIDHPTRAEEAARPEGSVRDWGAVLESDAVWLDDHKQGPGLYGTIKPFSDHAAMIEEKGPYAGVSIRANGNAVMEAGKQKLQGGLPILAELTAAEGVDMVTRAGAGGMFLSESSRTEPNNSEGQVFMTEAEKLEVTKLIESAVSAATSPLKARALRGDAMVLAGRVLAGVAFTEAQKQFVIEQALDKPFPLKEGAIDEAKFSELVIVEAKRVGVLLGNGAAVKGLGVAVSEGKKMKECPTCEGDGKDEDGEDCDDCGGSGKVAMKAKESRASFADEDKELAGSLASVLGLSESAATRAAKGRD